MSAATPNRAMNPTDAGTLRYCPVAHRATIPPSKENGKLAIINPACRSELKEENKRKKINPIVIGTMIRSLAIARCMFSNAPPHTIEYPVGRDRCAASFRCPSSTTL